MNGNSKPPLTIAVPTFNRSALLEVQLNKLHRVLTEQKQLPRQVEILVSDNCSTDNTQNIIKKFTNVFKDLVSFRSLRQDKNIGFDGNIQALFSGSRGEYIWFLSDDDNFHTTTIQTICETILQNNRPTLIILNSYNDLKKDGQLIDMIPYSHTGRNLKLSVGKMKTLETDEERLLTILLSGQISHCVVKKMNLDLDLSTGGGGLHGQIVNYSLLQNPTYFITEKGLIQPGSKYDLSYWFIDSVLFGTAKLFGAPNMKFPKPLVQAVVKAHAQLILHQLENRCNDCRRVDYPEISEFKPKLEALLNQYEIRLDRNFTDSNKNKRLFKSLACPTIRLLKKVKGKIASNLRDPFDQPAT